MKPQVWGLHTLLATLAVASPFLRRSDGFGSDPVTVATPELEAYIKQTMDDWHIAGLAIAIIDGGRTWAKGYGISSHQSNASVTPSTLFMGGSTTKSMTAAAMSLLKDQSSNTTSPISWDTPLQTLIGPTDFQLSDPSASHQTTLADALSHRTGIARADLAVGRDARDTVRRMRFLPFISRPRTTYMYSNQMYAAVGYAIEVLSGLPLARFLRERLWLPLGMASTFLTLDEASASGTVLSDEFFYNNDTGGHEVVPHLDLAGSAGAGGVISNVLDYARYLRSMVSLSGPVSAAGHADLLGPQMLMENVSGGVGRPGRDATMHRGAAYYGFGWNGGVVVGGSGAEETWSHGGAIGQFRTEMLIIPRRKFGIIVMHNTSPETLSTAALIVRRVVYDFLGTSESDRVDWDGLAIQEAAASQAAIQTCKSQLSPILPNPPVPLRVPLIAFAGNYSEGAHGIIEVTLACNKNNNNGTSGTSGSYVTAPGSPASPTVDRSGCLLRVVVHQNWAVQWGLELEYAGGDVWVGWPYYLALAGKYRRPAGCIVAQFAMDNGTGMASRLSVTLIAGADPVEFTKLG